MYIDQGIKRRILKSFIKVVNNKKWSRKKDEFAAPIMGNRSEGNRQDSTIRENI